MRRTDEQVIPLSRPDVGPLEWERVRGVLLSGRLSLGPALDATRRDLLLIDDACEAIGAELRGRPIGAWGNAAAFGFYPNRQITTGESALEAATSTEELDNMEFFNAVSKRDVPNLLKAVDILVITLRDIEACKYGMNPNRIVYYVAAGTTVMCAVVGGVMEMIQEADDGLAVPPENPAALADAMVRLQESPVDRERFGQNGRMYVSRFHSRKQLASRLFDSLAAH